MAFAGCSEAPTHSGGDPRRPAQFGGPGDPCDAGQRFAALEWFRASGLGLHLEYGVHSQLGRGPAVQFEDRIPPSIYRQLKASFDASGFDAPSIVRIAAGCGFQYVGLTARHADGFCLFRTTATEFNALEATGRDLLMELCDACAERGLGLAVTFSYAADWSHPYFFPAESSWTAWLGARPDYADVPPEYRFERDEDFLGYVRDVHHQLQEIAYRYRPLAILRLEPEPGYHARPDLFPIGQTYGLLREACPGTLIAFGAGVTGDEDFCALPEVRPAAPVSALAAAAWERNRDKPREVPYSLASAPESQVSAMLEAYRARATAGAGCLMTLSLRADGSVPPAARRDLAEFARLRATS